MEQYQLICAHNGFTLVDLVTYNSRHNLANGEDNNDSENHNNSCKYGQVCNQLYASHEIIVDVVLRSSHKFFTCQ